jgi:hypothetical protein
VIDPEPEPGLERRSLLELLRGVAPEVLGPRVRLFVHLHHDALSGARDRVARVEGLGPMTLGQVRDWLGQTTVDLVPVLDLAGQEPVDGYEFPARIIEAVHQLQPVDAFPWAVNTGRRKDTDHPTAYVPMARGGPPGQTGIHNAARLTRHHHRIKTHTNWTATTVLPGAQLWRSPHGFWFLVDHTGTHRLPEHHATAIRPHHGLDFSPHERNLTLAVIHAT